MLKSLALSLGLTLLLELPGAWLLGIRKKQDLLLVALVNIVTNPTVVLILNLVRLQTLPPWYLIAALELAAVAIEGFIYHKGLSRKGRNPFLLSVILNGISYFGGLLLS